VKWIARWWRKEGVREKMSWPILKYFAAIRMKWLKKNYDSSRFDSLGFEPRIWHGTSRARPLTCDVLLHLCTLQNSSYQIPVRGRSQVLTAVAMQVTITWDMSSCSLVYRYWRFVGCYSFLLHGSKVSLVWNNVLALIWEMQNFPPRKIRVLPRRHSGL
jgi:hypothetical protein